ncbi:16S rRNA (cytosine(1402)-N(4))-methyltransferase RsmH [Oceanomicrobium pacificus]|uniref:Ribosomal RNA small subunit methyltransferase H n=1 Tax=Oceanomicrobium pacificus TaxID=2692916 RepID=A0A6B0TLL9_9RHOB|nr:16S rRNA (cytosine(1402)-N(4))-methyltransferase RsmH [Oceanomicrobium pacificus]MXU65417.1 16S rRNA (cytosine(1402)-N(4))-methyltransferase RsmH [Oceanomicrobium pacificus]
MCAAPHAPDSPHIPVLLDPLLDAVAPVEGTWLDGTFGAGGYSRGLIAAGAARVIGVDRDPDVLDRAAAWIEEYAGRIALVPGRFGDLDRIAEEGGAAPLDGIVLDIGVSSMQIDEGDRGFSFAKPGPLDMRMEQSGPSAADLVAEAPADLLADILFQYGEERASRRIARAIVAARAEAPITTTERLASVIASVMPRPRPGQIHPATRSFQALRIAVNDELGELVRGLAAAERVLRPGGLLAVVTFHSLEDRIVKRFIQAASGNRPNANRYAPPTEGEAARFERVTRKAVEADKDECARNPRARSARLRVARRTDAPAQAPDAAELGLPQLDLSKGGLA